MGGRLKSYDAPFDRGLLALFPDTQAPLPAPHRSSHARHRRYARLPRSKPHALMRSCISVARAMDRLDQPIEFRGKAPSRERKTKLRAPRAVTAARFGGRSKRHSDQSSRALPLLPTTTPKSWDRIKGSAGPFVLMPSAMRRSSRMADARLGIRCLNRQSSMAVTSS